MCTRKAMIKPKFYKNSHQVDVLSSYSRGGIHYLEVRYENGTTLKYNWDAEVDSFIYVMG